MGERRHPRGRRAAAVCGGREAVRPALCRAAGAEYVADRAGLWQHHRRVRDARDAVLGGAGHPLRCRFQRAVRDDHRGDWRRRGQQRRWTVGRAAAQPDDRPPQRLRVALWASAAAVAVAAGAGGQEGAADCAERRP